MTCPRDEELFAHEDNSKRMFKKISDASLEYYYFRPVAIVNRIDLAGTRNNRATCGSFRVIYRANRAGVSIAFEAGLPNPKGDNGILESCRTLANIIYSLSDDDMTIPAKTAILENIYFKGLGDYEPVVRQSNYDGSIGEVRANQNMQRVLASQRWTFRQYNIETCPADDLWCTVAGYRFHPVTVPGTPDPLLFKDYETSDPMYALATEFRAHFIENISSLTGDDITQISMSVPEKFEALESLGRDFINIPFDPNQSIFGSQFLEEIRVAIQDADHGLSAEDIAKRAEALTCDGCHSSAQGDDIGGGLTWPKSFGLRHTSGGGDAGPSLHHDISDGLRDDFLPIRKLIVEDFVCSPQPVSSAFLKSENSQTLSGIVQVH